MAGRFAIPREAVYGSNGEPLNGAKLFFYESGTTTPNNTYSDDALSTANTNPVVADASGRFGDIFLKDEDYKVVLKTSADVTIFTADPVRAATSLSTTVRSVSTTETLTAADNGGLVSADATSGAFTITLLPAATAGNGYDVIVTKSDSSSNAVTIDADGSETINGSSDFSLPIQNNSVRLRSNGTSWIAYVIPATPANTPLPEGYIFGLTISIDSGDADHDVAVATGSARDGGNESNIILSTAIVKRIDAAWAEGTGNGGLDSGSVAASTVYHVWLIKSTANNTTDVLLSTSSSSPTLPTSPVVYDLKRRIGAVVTDSSSNITGSLTQVHAGGQESYESEQLTIASGALESPLHGLSAVPKSFKAYLHCKVATWGFAIGDRVEVASVQDGGSNDSGRGVTVIPFSSSISARFGPDTNPLKLIRQDGGGVADVPPANFDLVLRATLY